MYYFLGIVLKNDIRKSVFLPSYVLSRRKRSGEICFLPPEFLNDEDRLACFVSFTGNDELMRKLPETKTYDKKKIKYNRKNKYGHYTEVLPVGYYFWFRCDDYGNQNLAKGILLGEVGSLTFDEPQIVPPQSREQELIRLYSDFRLPDTVFASRLLSSQNTVGRKELP